MSGSGEKTMAKCTSCGAPMESSSTNQVCPKCLLGIGVLTQIERPLEPGAIFHGLEIVQMLGRGGMGVVYKARQPSLDRFVAIKILPKALGQRPELIQRFTQEAKALASLTHPNIVAVHDFGKEGDQLFFVMEFVDGTNLRPLLRSRELKAREALEIIPTLCNALAYAHSHGVVHRDIKPENILIDKQGRVKIADFGLAKILFSEHATPSMTQTDVAMGTPHYMAPEQFESAKSVDHRADIYSMGVLFYEMLTGELPLGRFSLPSKHGVDVRLDEIVLRALDKDPAKRYQKMEDVGRDVTSLSGISVSKAPQGPASSRANPLLVAGALIMLVGIVYLAAELHQVRQQQAKAPPTVVVPQPPPAPPAPVKVDPWTAAKLADGDLPEGWRVGEASDATERAEVHKHLSWLTSEAESIEKVRTLVFLGPDDYSVHVTVYQCRSSQALDKCVAILQQKVLGMPNQFAVDKENVLIYALTMKEKFYTRDGEVAPAVESIEDALRAKFGLPPATHHDPSQLNDTQLPKNWKELRSGVAKKTTELPSLLAGFQPPIKPPPKQFRDGWVRSYGNSSTPGESVEVFSFRFFESDPAKEFTQELRTFDPAGGQGMNVLREYERVVAVFYSLKDGNTPAPVSEYLKHLAGSMRATLDRFDFEVKVTGPATKDDKSIKVPLEFRGINSREIRKAGVWSVQVWNFTAQQQEEAVEIQVPVAFEHVDGRMTTIFSMPLEPVRIGLHANDDNTTHLAFHIKWGQDNLEGKDIDVEVK
jgi:tRNA A-37 threonylcarbamoyl transferase component Bud32